MKKTILNRQFLLVNHQFFGKTSLLLLNKYRSWNKNLLKDLIYKTNEIELLVKKNSVLAKNILADFIINNSKKTNN